MGFHILAKCLADNLVRGPHEHTAGGGHLQTKEGDLKRKQSACTLILLR